MGVCRWGNDHVTLPVRVAGNTQGSSVQWQCSVTASVLTIDMVHAGTCTPWLAVQVLSSERAARRTRGRSTATAACFIKRAHCQQLTCALQSAIALKLQKILLLLPG